MAENIVDVKASFDVTQAPLQQAGSHSPPGVASSKVEKLIYPGIEKEADEGSESHLEHLRLKYGVRTLLPSPFNSSLTNLSSPRFRPPPLTTPTSFPPERSSSSAQYFPSGSSFPSCRRA
jgi:hypothetical protein